MAVQPWGDYFSRLACRFDFQSMYFFDSDNHHVSHIHLEYGESSVALAIANGEILAGEIPKSKRKRRPPLRYHLLRLHRHQSSFDRRHGG